jgi:hypothetical protein
MGAAASRVERARDQLLADPAFTRNQDLRVRMGDSFDLLDEFHHLLAGPDQF